MSNKIRTYNIENLSSYNEHRISVNHDDFEQTEVFLECMWDSCDPDVVGEYVYDNSDCHPSCINDMTAYQRSDYEFARIVCDRLLAPIPLFRDLLKKLDFEVMGGEMMINLTNPCEWPEKADVIPQIEIGRYIWYRPFAEIMKHMAEWLMYEKDYRRAFILAHISFMIEHPKTKVDDMMIIPNYTFYNELEENVYPGLPQWTTQDISWGNSCLGDNFITASLLGYKSNMGINDNAIYKILPMMEGMSKKKQLEFLKQGAETGWKGSELKMTYLSNDTFKFIDIWKEC